MPKRMYLCQKCNKAKLFESSDPNERCGCGGRQFTRATFPESQNGAGGKAPAKPESAPSYW